MGSPGSSDGTSITLTFVARKDVRISLGVELSRQPRVEGRATHGAMQLRNRQKLRRGKFNESRYAGKGTDNAVLSCPGAAAAGLRVRAPECDGRAHE
jgi:hypothetical protein